MDAGDVVELAGLWFKAFEATDGDESSSCVTVEGDYIEVKYRYENRAASRGLAVSDDISRDDVERACSEARRAAKT